MANVEQHYDQVLAAVYSWMYGLAQPRVEAELARAGFANVAASAERGFVTIVATGSQ